MVKSSPDDDNAGLARELFTFGRTRLSGYKLPKQIAFVDALPRSHFGKLLKRELREMKYQELHRLDGTAAPVQSRAS